MKQDSARKFPLNKVLLVLALIAVLWFLKSNINEIRHYSFNPDLNLIALAFLCAILGHLCNFSVWVILSKSFGINTSAMDAAKAWFLSKLGRYIPGKLPFLIYRLSVYKSFPKQTVTVATVVEYISSIAAASAIVLLGIVFAPSAIPDYIKWVCLTFFLLFPVVLKPEILQPVYNFAMKKLKRSNMVIFPKHSIIYLSVTGHILAGMIHGFGLFLLLRSVYPISISFYPAVTGIYFGAGLVGLAAVFAPGGIGVLEGFMLLFLPSIVPEPVAIVGTIGIRIIVTVTELILTGSVSAIHHFSRNSGTRDKMQIQ